MTLIHLSIFATKDGLKIKERPFDIVAHHPKTIEIRKSDDTTKLVKKSKIGTNNSTTRQDLIGVFHFVTWVLPHNIEATKEQVVAKIVEEAKVRIVSNSAVIDGARQFFNLKQER